MPRPKFNQALKDTKPEFRPYELATTSMMVYMNNNPVLTYLNPELADKYAKQQHEYFESCTPMSGDEIPKGDFSYPQTNTTPKRYGGDPEKAKALINTLDEIAEFGQNLDTILPKEAEPVKNFIKAQFTLTANKGGSILELYNDNQYLDDMNRFLTYGPKMPTKKKGDKTVIDYKKMAENLKGDIDPETGKDDGILEPLMDIYGSITELVDLEMERQKNEKNGWTEKSKKDYLTNLKKNLDTVSAAFDKMKEAEKKHPGKYGTNVLNNALEEITGSVYNHQRDLNRVIGFLKGQSKAIENGWEPDELFLLGTLGGMNEDLIKRKRDIVQEKEYNEKLIRDAQKKIDENNRKLEELDKSGYKPRTTDDIAREIEKMEKDVTIKAVEIVHNDYIAKFNELQVDKKKNAAKIAELNEKFKVNEEDFAKNKARLSALLDELANPPKDKREELRKANEKELKDIRDYQKRINALEKRHENIIKFDSEFNSVYSEVMQKKVKDNNDKKEVLGKIKNLNKYVKDNLFTTGIYSMIVKASEKAFKKLENKLELGMLPEINEDDDRQMNLLRLYGPNHQWKKEWGTKSGDRKDVIITKKDFVDNIKMYKNDKGLPFNESEIAFLAVAGTFSAQKENRAIKDNKFIKNDADLMKTNSGLWTYDIMRSSENPREGLYKFAPMIKCGREKADEALGEYKKGNKDKMAALVHDAFAMTMKNWNERTTLRQDAYFSLYLTKTLGGLLEKDKGLKESFDKINNAKPENERVDLAQIKRIEYISGIRVRGLESADKFKAQAEERAEELKSEDKANKRVKTKIDNANAQIEIIDTKLDLLAAKKKKTQKDIQDEKTLKSQKRAQKVEIADAERIGRSYSKDHAKTKLAYDSLSRSAVTEVVKGNLMNELYINADRARNRKPEVLEIAKAQAGLREVLDPDKQAAVAVFQAAKYNHEPSAFAYLSTEEGKKKLDDFTENLIDKYKLDLDTYDNLKNERVPAKEKANCAKFNAELNIFCYETENAGIIERLKTEKLSEQTMRDLTAEYIKNNYFLRESEHSFETGKTDDFVSINPSKILKNEAKHRKFENAVDEYVKNMDFKDLSGKELAETLYGNSFKKNDQNVFERRSVEEDFFYETAKNIRNEIEFSTFAQNVNEGKKPELNLKAKIKSLEEAKFDISGSKSEFKNFVKELKDFDRYVRKTDLDWDIRRTYPGEELAKKEKALSEKIASFAANQNDGLKAALTEIKKDIDKRYKFDKTAVTIDSEMVESVKAYRADHNVLKEVEGTKKQLSDAEARAQYDKTLAGLDKMIESEEKRREVLAEEMKAVGKKDKKAFNDSFDEMVSSAFFGLYLNMLKKDYAVKPGMGSKDLLENEERLKKAVSEGCDKKVIGNMLKTDFGLQFTQKLFDSAMKKEPDLSQEKILQHRDAALNKAFDNLAGSKAAQIKKIAQVLGSDVLNNKGRRLKPNADDSQFELSTLLPKKPAAKKTL